MAEVKNRLKAIVRYRIRRAIMAFYGLRMDDVVGHAGEPAELEDLIMQSLFGKWDPDET